MVYEYFLPKQSENLKVCHDFFCKTLNISYKPIVKAHQSSSETGEFIGKDGRGTHEPHNKLPANVLKAIKDHIESFPMMDSHYCRKSSGRQYLSSRLSVAKMYDLFKETRLEKLVSFEKYKQVFGTEYNLAFHRPRKGNT
uniref:Uncharacterized protein n=1 Tax=Romanomermis culicivorax TaxID=13658 RepID=A0A915INS8_ROMCU